MATARAVTRVLCRRCVISSSARRTYTTPTPAAAAEPVQGSSSDLVDEISSLARRLPPAKTPADVPSRGRKTIEPPEPVPPHPEWVLGSRPEYYDPPVHPKKLGIHVATLSFTAYNPDKDQLPLATGFALQAAWHLGIPCSRPAAFPIKRELHTVLRSGFVHKKSQENFWRLTHKRVIRAYDANEAVVNRWINYLTDECVAANVSIKADRITYRPLGWGERLNEEAARDRKVRAAERAKGGGGMGRRAKGKAQSGADKTTEEQVKALAEELIEKELAPKAEAAEKKLKETGTEHGREMGTLEEVDRNKDNA